jgi:hypothetical protein
MEKHGQKSCQAMPLAPWAVNFHKTNSTKYVDASHLFFMCAICAHINKRGYSLMMGRILINGVLSVKQSN